MIKWGLSQGWKLVQYSKINQCNLPYQQAKKEKIYDYICEQRKILDKSQHPFMTLKKEKGFRMGNTCIPVVEKKI